MAAAGGGGHAAPTLMSLSHRLRKVERQLESNSSLDVASEKVDIYMRHKEKLDPQTLKMAVKLSLDIVELVEFGKKLHKRAPLRSPRLGDDFSAYEQTVLKPLENYVRSSSNAEKRAACMTRPTASRVSSSISRFDADAVISGASSHQRTAVRGTCCTCLTAKSAMSCATCGEFLCFECVNGNASVNGSLLSCPGHIEGRKCVSRWCRTDLRKLAQDKVVQPMLEADALAYDATFDNDTRVFMLQTAQELVAHAEAVKKAWDECGVAAENLVRVLAGMPGEGRAHFNPRYRTADMLTLDQNRIIRGAKEAFVDAQDVLREGFHAWCAAFRRLTEGHLGARADDGSTPTDEPDREPRRFGCPKAGCRGFFVHEGSATHCVACTAKICELCHEEATGDAHACAAGAAASISAMIKNTQSCPRCFLGIHRTSGCDQMYCTVCNTAFSYRTGRVIPANENIHNPHFFTLPAEVRARINADRAKGLLPDTGNNCDLACEMLPSRRLEAVVESGVQKITDRKLAARVVEAFRYACHISADGPQGLRTKEAQLRKLHPERIGRVERVAGLLPPGATFERLTLKKTSQRNTAIARWAQELTLTTFVGEVYELSVEKVFLRGKAQLARDLVQATEEYNLESARFTLKTAFVACVTEIVRMAAIEPEALKAIGKVWEAMEFDDIDDIVEWRVEHGHGKVSRIYREARQSANDHVEVQRAASRAQTRAAAELAL